MFPFGGYQADLRGYFPNQLPAYTLTPYEHGRYPLQPLQTYQNQPLPYISPLVNQLPPHPAPPYYHPPTIPIQKARYNPYPITERRQARSPTKNPAKGVYEPLADIRENQRITCGPSDEAQRRHLFSRFQHHLSDVLEADFQDRESYAGQVCIITLEEILRNGLKSKEDLDGGEVDETLRYRTLTRYSRCLGSAVSEYGDVAHFRSSSGSST
jgi:hypothetical protein